MQKNSLGGAKNVVFFLFCVLVDRPIGRSIAPPPPPFAWLRYWWGRSPSRWAIFRNFLEKKAILIPLEYISHVFTIQSHLKVLDFQHLKAN